MLPYDDVYFTHTQSSLKVMIDVLLDDTHIQYDDVNDVHSKGGACTVIYISRVSTGIDVQV